jgi:acyl carrier protein
MWEEIMTLNFIREIIAEMVEYDEVEEVTSELSISDDLSLDSDDLQRIIDAIEDEFGIEIPEEEIEAFEFIQDIEEYVSQAI